jgi:peptidyl-prolyl cis-trans isomerase C
MSPSSPLSAPTDPEATADEPDGYRYHLLRAATTRFQRNIPALTADELKQAEALARRSFSLEDRVLRSPEADEVLIPEAQVERAFSEVAQRYSSQDELEEDLERNGLDTAQLRRALRRELIFDAAMQRVGAQHAPISDADARLFFELHCERFATPETRDARHILITINDDYTENCRAAARARIDAIAERLQQQGAGDDLPERFAQQAQAVSECPTALEGGKLGTLRRGQLYPELDTALFALPPGAVSDVLESELGFHLLLCEAVNPPRSPPFDQVRTRIQQALEQRRRKERQFEWLASLAP